MRSTIIAVSSGTGLATAALGLIIMTSLATTSQGHFVESCPSGATVTSMSANHGHWLDFLFMTCTGGDEQGPFPSQGVGGERTSDMCADTDGIESIQWYEASPQTLLYNNRPLVYVTVTCLDGSSYLMANDLPLDIWGVGDTIFVESCGEGESVTGFNYDFVTWDYNDGDTYGGDAIFGEYVITSIGLECSTSDLVDARMRTTVTQDANAYDPKTSSDGGCDPAGCTPDLSRDRSLGDTSRWSCSEQLNGTPCKITYEFGEPQDIVRLNIKFYKGDQRVRTLNITGSDGFSETITSSGSSDGYESFDVNTDETSWLSMEPVGLGSREWISLIEVQFLVE